MYGNATFATPAIAAGAALPFTGLSVVWYVIAGFALLAAGLAVHRVVPRRQA
jgi:hypothetical protein